MTSWKTFKLNKISELEKIILKLNDILKDRFYLEIQRHGDKDEKNFENYLIEVSRKHKLPIIASQEVFYLKEDMFEAHDALMCIGRKQFIDDKSRPKLSSQHFFKVKQRNE